MLAQERQKATLLNRNNDITPDHTVWIKEQFKTGKIMTTRGREVLVKAAGRNLRRIVNIPNVNDPRYRMAWVTVYNLCLDYLEGSLNSACLENRFIQRMGNSWTVNGHVIIWPKFDRSNANYARGLEKILDEYNYVKSRYIASLQKKKEGVTVKKSSVKLTSVQDVDLKSLTSVKSSSEVRPAVIKAPSLSQVKPSAEVGKGSLDSDKMDLNKRFLEATRKRQSDVVNKNANNVSDSIAKKVEQTAAPKVNTVAKSLPIYKVSDGDLLSSRDITQLKSSNTDIVVLTCQDVLNTKEEDLFYNNAGKCHKEKLNIGAFIYGRATDEHDGAGEIKRIIKMLNKVNDCFSGLIIYSINNDYVLKNKDSDIKLLDYINVYNAILRTLKQTGNTVMLSMNLQSGKILDDINRRYNMQNEHDVIYMVVVRDAGEVSDGASSIIVDPWNDYDVVNIKNTSILNILKSNKA